MKHKTPNYRFRHGYWQAVPLRQTRKDLAPHERVTNTQPFKPKPRRSPILAAMLLGTAMAMNFRRF